MAKLIGFLAFALIPAVVNAGFYIEFGFEGGEENLKSVPRYFDSYRLRDSDIKAGGGVKLALGIQNTLGENKDRSITLTLGRLSDEPSSPFEGVEYDYAKYDTVTFDAIYGFHFDSHRLGIGASYHKDPEFKADENGLPTIRTEFDDAAGLIIQYTFAPSSSLQIGLRLTEMNYEANDIKIDAGSIGLFIGYASQ